MRPVMILAIGVIVGGGIAAIGLDWKAAPAAAAGPGSPARETAQAEPASGDMQEPASSEASQNLEGKVLETVDASRYTYLRLDVGQGGEAWAAVPKAPVAVGAHVRIGGALLMRNFQSTSLKRTFDEIYFGELQTGTAPAQAESPHGGMPQPQAQPGAEIAVGKVKPAEGELGRTIAQIIEQAAKLEGKRVQVRGVVVKSTVGVLDRNWLHIRDGSASKPEADDLLVTTKDEATPGQTVLVEGTVSRNKDFGAGYSYAVLVEDATVKVSP